MLNFYRIDRCLRGALTTAVSEVETPPMHWALDPPGLISKAADQWPATMWTAIFDGEYSTTDIEKGDIDTVELDQLPATKRHVVERTGCEPLGGHRKVVSSQYAVVSRKRL